MGKFTGFCAAFALIGMASANAQTAYQLNSSSGITINSGLSGWSVTLSGCSFTLNGAASNCSAVEVMPTVSLGTMSLVFSAFPGGGALETSSPGNLSDLTVALMITPSGGDIWRATTDVSGSSTGGSADLSRIAVSDSSIATSYGSVVGPMSSLGNSLTLATATFAPTPTLSTTLDIRAAGTFLGQNSLGTLTMNSATVTYSVPEPVSASVLLGGLAGIGLIRRRRGIRR